MNYRIFILFFTLFISSYINGLTQTVEEIKTWQETLANKSLFEIGEITQTNTNYSWPKILSSYAIDKLPKEQQELNKQYLELAKAFRAKLETSFQRDLHPEKAELEKEVKTYTTLASQFRESGGYGNLLLADSLYQLVIFRLSGWLVQHPDKATEVEEMTKGWNVTPVELKKTLTEMADQDKYLEQHRNEIKDIDESKNLYVGLEPIGLNINQIVGLTFPVEKKWTSHLIENPSVVSLIYRMAQTEMLMKANLMGFIEFLKQGGTFSELNPQDSRPFNERMSDKRTTYNYPLLDIRFLSVNQPLFLMEWHRNPTSKEVRLNQALK